MRVVLCNCPPEAAPGIARALVERQLAACVNLVPGIKSVYRWQGEIIEDGETTLLIKAGSADLGALRAAIVELHPYPVPEILALDVDTSNSHAPYVEWVRQMTA